MAHLLVGADDFTLDDRLLEHVRFVVTQKLRRNESFLLTWSYPAHQGSGRRSVWIHDGSMLQFRFAKESKAPLNPEWLKALLEASHSVRGLNLDDVPEPSVAVSHATASDSASTDATVGVGRRT
ncbi:hypothetical protein [Labedella endophytica]|uniref:DUF7882 domain-containing protein n=1 Tax=Labedella endophytica TaxID=1523160 RepID=A0A3S0VDH5_9MICO|nr:hypothetical protein [Labedella endophytica]RUR03580.1 hypothetical protein ELQ94_03360 [Labedella endophytica]